MAGLCSDIGAPLLSKCMEGFNTALYAYGATGTGKTYTLMGEGTARSIGIVPRAVTDLFKCVESVCIQCTDTASD